MCRRFSVDLLDLFISKRYNATATELYQYTPSVDINNTHYKRIQSLIQNHMRHVRIESAREQRIALYKSYE